MNIICIIGNLTKAPETREVGDDNSVTTMRVAVNGIKPRNGADAKVTYIDVKVWGAQGKNCERFLDKGSKVGVKGRLEIDEVDAREGGGKRYFTSIVADNFGVDFLSPKGEGEGEPVAAGAALDDIDF